MCVQKYICTCVRTCIYIYLFVCSRTVHTLRIYQSKEHKTCKPTAYSLSPRLSWPSLDLFALLSPVHLLVHQVHLPSWLPFAILRLNDSAGINMTNGALLFLFDPACPSSSLFHSTGRKRKREIKRE